MSEIKVEVWKKKPEFMNKTEKLTAEEIKEAVKQLTVPGLELCAAGYFLSMTALRIAPADVARFLEEP